MILDHKTTFDTKFYFIFSISFFRNQLVLPSTGQVLQAGAVKYSLHTITVALTVQGGTAGGAGAEPGRRDTLRPCWPEVQELNQTNELLQRWRIDLEFSNYQRATKTKTTTVQSERESVFFCFVFYLVVAAPSSWNSDGPVRSLRHRLCSRLCSSLFHPASVSVS